MIWYHTGLDEALFLWKRDMAIDADATAQRRRARGTCWEDCWIRRGKYLVLFRRSMRSSRCVKMSERLVARSAIVIQGHAHRRGEVLDWLDLLLLYYEHHK